MAGSNFKEAFLEAISQAEASGQLNRRQARLLRWKATESRRAEKFLEEAEAELSEDLLLAGAVSATGAFDWKAFLEFIIKNLPAIINLFSLL